MKDLYGPRFRALHWCTEQMITTALAQMDLTASQGRIIGFIARVKTPPCSKDIEDFFHLSHPSVWGTLSRMEKKGFLQLCPDPQDRRCKRLHLLPKGQACHAAIEQTISQIEDRMVQGFSPEERRLFSAFLDRSIENMRGTLCCPHQKEE